MRKAILSAVAAVALGGSLGLAGAKPASAAEAGHILGVQGGEVATSYAQYGGRGYYGRQGYGGRYYGRRSGGGVAAGVIGGLAAGALIGGAIASQASPAYGAPVYGEPVYAAPGGGDWLAYCSQRYQSFDPASGTFLGYDGLRHPCE